jgi:Rrf2 family protein
MAANLRFSTGIEALALMATEPERYHTSQSLATALSTNAVVVRRILSALSRAGLVTSAKGPSGGSHLNKTAKQITLRDIYRALIQGDLLHCGPHESAEIREFHRTIRSVFRKVQRSLEEDLDSITLNQIIKKSGKKVVKAAAQGAEADGRPVLAASPAAGHSHKRVNAQP